MRVTITPSDGFVSVDNEGYSDLDLSFIPQEVHSLQWYDDAGELECQDKRGRATHNEEITALEQFEYWGQCYAVWKAAHDEATKPPPEPEPQPEPEPDPKLVGVEFDGVMCSATKDDQSGLTAVLLAVQLQGANFPPTNFYFKNGSQLVITKDNVQSFMDVWIPFRQSFFAVDET